MARECALIYRIIPENAFVWSICVPDILPAILAYINLKLFGCIHLESNHTKIICVYLRVCIRVAVLFHVGMRFYLQIWGAINWI